MGEGVDVAGKVDAAICVLEVEEEGGEGEIPHRGRRPERAGVRDHGDVPKRRHNLGFTRLQLKMELSWMAHRSVEASV